MYKLCPCTKFPFYLQMDMTVRITYSHKTESILFPVPHFYVTVRIINFEIKIALV
jgi:hypothetical protein